MRNQRGKMSGQRLSKVIVSLTLALMLLCGNFSTTAPAILNALALEVVAETPAAPVEQPQEPAPQQEAEAPVEQASDPVPQGEIVPEGKPEGEAKPATPTTDEPTKTDAPETPAAGTPAADAPATDAPAAGNPATEPSETDTSETPATDTPATDEPTKTDTPATDTPATDTPATDVPATDVPMVDERSPLQRAIEDESGAYVDVQNGKVYENQNLNKLMGVLDGGLAFATEYTVREDGEDSVRVIFRTEDDSLLMGFIPASRATELGRQQTIDELTGKGVTFLFNKEPDLPLSVIGFTYAQDETEQGDSENPPAEEEAPAIVVEEIEPYVAAAIRNSVNLRKEPSTSGPLMAQLDKGVRMTVRGKLTNAEGELWYYVTYHQNPYYVMAELVEAVDAPTEQPAESDTPADAEIPADTETNPDTPVDEVFDFVFMAYPGELPVTITANGDDYYTHTAADGTLTLLAYGSFKGAQPAFYAVDENENVQTDAPFGMDAPALDLTVEPDEEETVNPFIQMDYTGEPITGITANGDGYYTYTAPDGTVTLLVYGSANSGEPAFYAVDEDLVINLTAPFVPEATPTAAPETDELVFMPLMPDSSAVPEYYQLVSAPSTTEEAEPAASAFLNWLLPRACAEEEVPEPTGDSDTPGETAGETQPSAPAQESTAKYIYSFTVDNKGVSEIYYRVYGSLKRKNGEVIAVGFFACDKDGSFDTSNYMLIDPKNDFAQMNAEDKEAALITMLKTLPTLAEVEALVASDAAGTAATLASTEATLESIRQQMDALQLNMSSDEQAAFTANLTKQTPEGMQNYAGLTAYFANVHAQQLADVQAAIDALPTVEAVQAMDVTAEDYAQRFAAVETATAAAQTLLTAYKATLTEEALANLEALLGTPEVAESNGETPANGETSAEAAPAEGETPTEAASQPTRLAKLNALTAYFADQRFEAMVRELQVAVAKLPTAEAHAAMTMDSDEYLAAKTQYNAAWTTLQSLYAQMTEADKTRFAADERVLAALQAMTDLFTYFENNEIPYMQTAIDGMPDPYWTGFLAELLYSDTDNSASMYDLPTGETPAEAPTGETPAEAPSGETAGETPATDATDPAASEADFLVSLQEVYDGLGLTLDPADPRAAGDELVAELWESLGDVQPRTMFLTHDAVDTEAGQAYLDEKLGAQEDAETTRLEKYNTLLGIMQGISGIQTMANHASLDADLARISKLEVTAIVDGTTPWDGNDNAGNDSAPDNKIVRTFDGITYTLSATTTPYIGGDTFDAAKAKFEFVLPATKDEAEFDTAAMGWMMDSGAYQWTLTTETRDGKECQVLTGWRDIPQDENSKVSVPGTFTVNVNVKVNAMANNATVQPTFSAALEHNTWSDTPCTTTGHVREKMTIQPAPVKVTAAPKYNIVVKYTADTYKGLCDFSKGTFTPSKGAATNQNIGSAYGRVQPFGIQLQLHNTDASKGLKGIDFPDGSDITFKLKLSSTFTKDAGHVTVSAQQVAADGFAPLLWSYGGNDYNKQNTDGRKADSVFSYIRNIAWNKYMAFEDSSCTDGGVWTAIQSGSEVQITISNYKLDYSHFPSAAADPNSASFNDNVGVFSAGEFWVLQPYNTINSENTTNVFDALDKYGDGTFALSVEATDLSMTSVSSQTQIDPAGTSNAQPITTDDRATATFAFIVPGYFQQRVFYTNANNTQALEKGMDNTFAMFSNGRDIAALGQSMQIAAGFNWQAKSEEDNRLYYATNLLKFDAAAIELVGTRNVATTRFGGLNVNVLFATKKSDPTSNWESDAELQAATEDQLVFYNSLAGIPSGQVCVAALIQYTGPANTLNEISPYVALPAKVKTDPALANKVYMLHAITRVWNKENLAIAGKTIADMPDWTNPATQLSDFPSFATNSYAYRKESYAADGSGPLGTHTGLYYAGDSLLIVSYKASIEKNIAQEVGNPKDEKIRYDLDANQRVIDFVLQPSTAATVAAVGGQSTTVTIVDTLPKYATYRPGSSYFGGTYSMTSTNGGTQGNVTGGTLKEPNTVKNNADGTSTLTWVIENVTVGATMPPIYYSCNIGSKGDEEHDVPTGTTELLNKVRIYATDDIREPKKEYGNYAEKGFSVIRNSATSFAKIAKYSLIEPDGTAGYTIFNGNNSAAAISTLFMDTMPYNGDSRGSQFSGTYSITGWKIATDLMGTSALTLYYTYDPAYREKTADDVAEAEITAGWTQATIAGDGTATLPNNGSNPPVAWALVGTQAGNSTLKVELDMKLAPTDPQIGDKYTNAVSLPGNSTTVDVRTIRRTLEGVTWLDANYDGFRVNETMLSGVKVTLMKLKDGATDTTLEANYEVYSPMIGGTATPMIVETGKQKDTITGAETAYEAGRYRFNNLPAGTFAVKFESGSTSIASYRASPVNAKDAQGNNDDAKDSDGVPTYATSGTQRTGLTSTLITGVVMPAAADMSVSLYESKFHDSGFDILRTNVTVSKAVSGNAGDRTKDFSFTVTIRDGSNTAVANTSFDCAGGVLAGVTGVTAPSTTTVTTNASGQATITLKHGQTVTIKDLPTTYDVQVAETSPVSEGYSTNYTYKVAGTVVNNNVAGLDTGVKELNVSKHLTDGTIEPQSAAFTNTRTITVPTGILLDIWPYLLILAVAMGGVAWLLISKRKSNHRKQNSDNWN